MEVSIRVGGWEHDCCGEAVERGHVVALGCLRSTDEQGRTVLTETHHDLEPAVRITGRVSDIHVVRAGHPVEAVLRVPGGRALRGLDPHDDGHLEDPWTGAPVAAGTDFIVHVETT